MSKPRESGHGVALPVTETVQRVRCRWMSPSPCRCVCVCPTVPPPESALSRRRRHCPTHDPWTVRPVSRPDPRTPLYGSCRSQITPWDLPHPRLLPPFTLGRHHRVGLTTYSSLQYEVPLLSPTAPESLFLCLYVYLPCLRSASLLPPPSARPTSLLILLRKGHPLPEGLVRDPRCLGSGWAELGV